MARTRLSRLTESSISPPMGIWPPTSPVLPACGTTGMACSLASARICDTSSVEPGRSTTEARPCVHVAPLAQVGELLVGVGERVLRADDGGEAGDEIGAQALVVGLCWLMRVSLRGAAGR